MSDSEQKTLKSDEATTTAAATTTAPATTAATTPVENKVEISADESKPKDTKKKGLGCLPKVKSLFVVSRFCLVHFFKNRF